MRVYVHHYVKEKVDTWKSGDHIRFIGDSQDCSESMELAENRCIEIQSEELYFFFFSLSQTTIL